MDLTVRIYSITRSFPAEEKFGIISQMRRAASSIPSNIAEGQARSTTAQFLHFLSIARGSLAEQETFVTLSSRLDLLTQPVSEDLLTQCAEINKMLNGLIKSLSSRA